MKAIVKFERNEFAKNVRKLYEKGELKIKRKEMKKMTIRNDGISNTLTRVTKTICYMKMIRICAIRGRSDGDWHNSLHNQRIEIGGQTSN